MGGRGFIFEKGNEGSDFYPVWLWQAGALDRNLVRVSSTYSGLALF